MENNNKRGRPTNYEEAFAEQAYKLCLLGATDEQLADFFEVSRVTIDHWKHEYPLFADALRRGKLTADGAIAESLFKSAQGYELTETTERIIDGKVACVITRKKCQPPNATAAIFWLKNRQKQTWNEKFNNRLSANNEPEYDDIIKPMCIVSPDDVDSYFEDAEKQGEIADGTGITPSPLIAREEGAMGRARLWKVEP